MFEDSTHGGRQNWWLRYPTFLRTSTHALTEGDFVAEKVPALDFHFNSRPHGGRPSSTHILSQNLRFQLTPSRRATLLSETGAAPSLFQLTPSRRATSARVSTDAVEVAFQLTPSRRATCLRSHLCMSFVISTHALTEGDIMDYLYRYMQCISTHALTEGDARSSAGKLIYSSFQLTPSRRATYLYFIKTSINIFQLTPSRRATDCRITSVNSHLTFQLTPSRRATGQVSFHCRYGEISTHALTEGDVRSHPESFQGSYFNSRPHGGRLTSPSSAHPPFRISTHALTEGDTRF